jgi:hypothetical protein
VVVRRCFSVGGGFVVGVVDDDGNRDGCYWRNDSGDGAKGGSWCGVDVDLSRFSLAIFSWCFLGLWLCL